VIPSPESLETSVRMSRMPPGDPVVRPRPKIDELEQLVDPRAAAVEVERGEQLKVLPAAQVRIEVGRLDESGDAVQRLGKLVLRVAAEQPASPLSGRIRPSRIRSVVVLPAPFGRRTP
jgi:hypothetical protein